MKAKIGNIFMAVGMVFLLGALSLFVYNQREATAAEQSAQELLPQLIQKMQEDSITAEPEQEYEVPPGFEDLDLPPVLPETESEIMSELEIEDHSYIGYLSIPKLGLDLPIMSNWDYDSLKIAPCRYYGSVTGEDLVLMAHNYKRHFGRLSDLTEGDSVLFVDIKGNVTAYEVIAKDVLAATAIEEMTSGAYDLTLFTCTYSGQERITVFCDKIKR